jgi:hypothetical protein
MKKDTVPKSKLLETILDGLRSDVINKLRRFALSKRDGRLKF